MAYVEYWTPAEIEVEQYAEQVDQQIEIEQFVSERSEA